MKSSGLSCMLLSAFICVATLTTAGATDAEAPPVPTKRTDGKSYAPFPNPDAGYVTDLAKVLSRDQEEHIERWLWQTEKRTNVEIAVVVISSIRDYPGTPNKTIETFAKGLFDAYGIGNMPKNDGVLLLVAVKDRKARIELGAGYGHARDGDATRIMQEVIVPKFAAGDYPGGISDGVQAIMLEFAHVRVGVDWLLVGILLAIPIVGVIAYSLFKSGKRGWGWVCAGLLIVLVVAAATLIVQLVRALPQSSSSSWSSGGSGGFGGGFSGGGGATGSW